MSNNNTGNIRSLTIIVTKYVNGDIAIDYPKTYDGKSGFTWIETYEKINEYDLQSMPLNNYLNRLNAWKSYVENQESGLNLSTDLNTSYPAYKEDTSLCPIEVLLEIVNIDLNCSGSTLTLEITGGTAPYQYSYNNGQTYTSATYDTSYIFTDLTGTTFQPMVIDSVGDYYRWEQITCDQVTVTFQPVFLTSYSTGYIEDEAGTGHTTGFTVTMDIDSTYDVEGFATSGTTFVGWTLYNPQTRDNVNNVHYIENNAIYQHVFKTEITIYGIFIKDGPITSEYCYFPTESGYTANTDDKSYYCLNCDNEVTVYFDKTEYYTNGVENSTWYIDEALTTTVSNGYYKLNSDSGQTLYQLINGVATADGICDGTLIVC